MAGRVLVFVPMLVLVALLFVMEETSDCGNGFGCFHAEAAAPENLSRKLLLINHPADVLKGFRPLSPENGGENVGGELRRVPSGPDPLHHNRSPKKPQTP